MFNSQGLTINYISPITLLMNKIWLIIEREYMTRVKSKGFILSTLLVPLGLALLIVLPFIAGMISEKEYLKIYVIDPSGRVLPLLKSNESFTFLSTREDYDSLKEKLRGEHREGILVIPEDLSGEVIEIMYFSFDNLTLGQEIQLRGKLKEILHKIKIENLGIPGELLEKLNFRLSLSTGKLSQKGEEKTNTLIAAMSGYIMAFLIYISMVIYGSFVMRGVVEEKANRVVEILICSVRPFDLMIGKIIGIGAMGITQFAIWVIMKTFFVFIGACIFSWFSMNINPVQLQRISSLQSEVFYGQIQNIMTQFHSFDFKLLFFFFFYFIGGYLLYSSLHAAVGSAVDQESDANQLVLPILIPLMIPMIILTRILHNPNGNIARFASIFPFFSPMAMLVRLASVEVPWYEILLSMILLILTFLGSVWISARIYRTGILMYGKKASFRELGHWILHKG